MHTNSCIFCRMIAGELATSIITQNDIAIVIKDIRPKADIHWLVIPRMHFADLRSLNSSDKELLGALMLLGIETIRDYAHNAAFRMVVNNGAGVGQEVFHSHIHLLAGKFYGE